MDLIPRVTHHRNEERFDQAVASQNNACGSQPGGGQPGAVVRRVANQAVARQALDGGRGRGCTDPQGVSHGRGVHRPAVSTELVEGEQGILLSRRVVHGAFGISHS